MTEENPAEDEAVRPDQSVQRPQQTRLTIKHKRIDDQPAASSSAAQNPQKGPAGVGDDAQIRFSRPMSHLSATVPPLNLGQYHRGISRGFYTFQTPASPRPDPRGGPGILVQAPVEQDSRPGIVASSTSPAVLHNTRPRIRAAPQADGHPRTNGHPPLSGRSHPTSYYSLNCESPPRTPPSRIPLTASQRAQQSAPKIGSPLRQSHQYIPYSPRDVGSPSAAYRPPRPQGPRPTEQLAQNPTTGDVSHQSRADIDSAANSQENNLTTLDQQHNGEAQNTVEDTHTSNVETHVVRFREPDLAGLIASGVIKVNPESHPPDWMLKYAPRFSSHKLGVQIFDNTERRTVKLRHSVDSIRRNRSHKADVERVGRGDGVGGGSRRYRSNDSGYCTASSSGLLSISTLGKSGVNKEEQKIRCKQPAAPLSWSQASSAPASQDEVIWRKLRRRSSVPELSSRFRVDMEEYELEGDEEEDSRTSLRDDYVWEERGPLGIMETRQTLDLSPLDSISFSGSTKDAM